MPNICKDFCSIHSPQFYVKNSKTNKTGINVLFCKTCNIFLKIKEAFTSLDLFKRFVSDNRCDCCGCKLRTNVRTRRQKEKYKDLLKRLIRRYRPRNQLFVLRNTYKKCGCGCKNDIPLINKKGESINFKHGHKSKKENRMCLYCGSLKTQVRKSTNTERWFKVENNGGAVICFNCYTRQKYQDKKVLTPLPQQQISLSP